MATKNRGEDWPDRLAESVGRQVKRYRERPESKMSAQALSARTAELGHELKRSVIANLESGRRDFVTVADVLVLAKALNVPPIALIVPIDEGEQVEILDGVFIDPWHAIDWINGLSDYVDSKGRAATGADHQAWYAAVEPFDRKRSYDNAYSRYLRAVVEATDFEDSPARELALSRVSELREVLRDAEARLAALGVIVPKMRRTDS